MRVEVMTGLLAFALARPAVAAADGANAPLSVNFHCEPSSSLGRVVCEIESEVTRGRIAWADVLVISAPEMAPPLRSRVGWVEALTRAARRVRLPVGFIAKELGTARIRVRSRLVVCTPVGRAEHCVPRSVEAETDLTVGPLGPPTAS